MADFDFDIQAALEGESFPWTSQKVPTKNGTITFWLHAPTETEMALATRRAGVQYNERGEVIYPKEFSDSEGQDLYLLEKQDAIGTHLVRLCLDRVEEYDRWPANSHRQRTASIRELTQAAYETLLMGPKRSTVLVDEMGAHLRSLILGATQKKHSAPPSSGPISGPATQSDTPTTAPDATTPTIASGGNATEATSPFTISEESE